MNTFTRAICSSLLFLLTFTSFGQSPEAVGVLTYVAAPFTPPASVAHYDASVASSIHTVVGVSQWDDLSGNGNNLLQASTTLQPIFAGTGTSSVVMFNGTSQFMKASFTLVQPETVYIVMERITGTVNGQWFDGASSTLSMGPNQSGTTDLYSNAGGVFIGPATIPTILTFFVFTNVFSASGSFSVNDGTKTTGSLSSATAAGGITIAARSSGAFNSNIAVKEIYVYSTVHSAALQTSMVAYLRAKWGI